MNRYPTENGIAVPPHELWLPRSRHNGKEKYRNNHHHHYSERLFLRSIATTALRDLDRHQTKLPVDVHRWLHDTYSPPEMPSEEQAAREVIDAYDQGEMFKIYDRYSKQYFYHEIPQDLADEFICKYSLVRVFDMAAD